MADLDLVCGWRRREEKYSPHIMSGDALHQQRFQFFLCEPPARAQRADGDRHDFRNQ